ncbi:hypothetical protein [Pseudomonas sp. NFACC37-1]|uniref:hypothetical protein n=1 Tax=Pseudomonas sp. NFACC37-1 TaxID=1566196 RepID=UPI000B833575|nr:hypothetical protein [Pseudomonas sp. NFACC37-1]
MVEKIDEQTILDAAREWASRTGRDEATAVSSASETMAALKAKLPQHELKPPWRIFFTNTKTTVAKTIQLNR